MSARDLVEIADRLASGIAAWLDGGWGIDRLFAQQTWSHNGRDLVVVHAVVGRLRGALCPSAS